MPYWFRKRPTVNSAQQVSSCMLTLEDAVCQHLRLQQLLQPNFVLCCLVRKIRCNLVLQFCITSGLKKLCAYTFCGDVARRKVQQPSLL